MAARGGGELEITATHTSLTNASGWQDPACLPEKVELSFGLCYRRQEAWDLRCGSGDDGGVVGRCWEARGLEIGISPG